MNAKIWFISDLHLFHANMLRGGAIGIRPFDTLTEMHERIIEGWNSVVKPGHKVYMMGDLTLWRPKSGRAAQSNTLANLWNPLAHVVTQLNGGKRILLGNHDHMKMEDYHALGFEKVLAYREMAGILFSHIPVHPSQFSRFRGNVHGHLHESIVKKHVARQDGSLEMHSIVPDYRYINVCCDAPGRNYVPMSLDEIVAHYDAMGKP